VGLSAIRAAAARHALVLDDLAIKVVLRLHNAAKEHPAVYAGVGAIMISSGWVRWVRGRLLCGHEALLRGPGPEELLTSCGAIYVVPVSYTTCTILASRFLIYYT
jgi:hypothetical protein